MTPKAAMAVHRVVATTTTRKPFVHVYWLKRPTTTTSSTSSTSSTSFTTSTSAWRDAVLKKYVKVASDLVGLDTEEERKRRRNKTNVLKLSKRRFSSMEVAQLEALPVEGDARLRRFLELWTLKESFLKATGLGISSPVGLRHCTFAFADDDDNDNDVGRRRRKRLSFGLDSKAAEAAADQMVYDDDDDETRLLRADDWRYCVYEPKPGNVASICWKVGRGVDDKGGHNKEEVKSLVADSIESLESLSLECIETKHEIHKHNVPEWDHE